MKRFIMFFIVLVMISLFFCSCDEKNPPTSEKTDSTSMSTTDTTLPTTTTTTSVSPTTTPINDVQLGSVLGGDVHFGIDKEALFAALSKHDISLIPPDPQDPQSEYNPDGSMIVRYADETVSLYITESYIFEINSSGTVSAVLIYGNNQSTEAGLKRWDNIERAKELYGNNFEEKTDDLGGAYIQYNFNGVYLMIGYNENLDNSIVNIRYSMNEHW